jgi:5-methylcytosine-specific restriction protein A
MTGPSRATRALVKQRANDRCEVCSQYITDAMPYSLQHRRARGMGGSSLVWVNSPINLLYVCGSATTPDMCHLAVEDNRKRDENIERGYVIPKNGNQHPASVPVLLWGFQWAYLTPNGYYEPIVEAS